ncbi:hypothetical protein JXA70_00985 [candidate division KSB1 bacterium]|nr:hypothetical protein [candidate division KSB1 bacterium]
MTFRDRIDQVFKYGEDVIYIAIGLLLFLTAILLLYYSISGIIHYIGESDHVRAALHVLDRMLLTLMIIEIFYTVRVSLKSHALCAEPFLIVGLIAAIRRILVISVEGAYVPEKFDHHMIESGILAALILIFVFSIISLRKNKQTGSLDQQNI